MLRLPAIVPACLAVFSSFGCQGPPAAPPPPSYTLVLLKTGPRTEPLTEAESSKVFAGHFGNMQRLLREGHLLLAGPYGTEKSDATLRGLFVLDAADEASARSLAETDPGFQAGVFALEYHRLETNAPLRTMLAEELAVQDAAAHAGKTLQPGEGCRNYVLLHADDWATTAKALAEHPAVLCFARLDGSRAMVWLDATDPTAARRQLSPVAEQLGPHTLDAWFGTGLLAELPHLQHR